MQELIQQVGPEQIVFTLFVLFLSLMWLNRTYSIPLLGVVNRWVRWIFFSLAIGVLIVDQELTDRPIWAVTTVAFLGWFLVETLYFWLYTRAISFSEIPLLPTYRVSERDEWPVDSRLIKLKHWLRTQNFKQASFLRAELGEELYIRNAVYENGTKDCRVEIMFLPARANRVQPFFIISSLSKDGRRLITNNVPMPFGGTYPENWNVVRKPLIRSVESLLKVHQKYVRLLEFELAALEETPVDEINERQQLLEKTNIQSGFILPREYHEDYGTLSSDARYRLWIEIWMISYLGRATGHRMSQAKA